MKNRKYLLLAVLPLFLTSCGDSNPTALPNEGTAMKKEAGQQALESSIEATSDGNIGFEINNTSLTLTEKMSIGTSIYIPGFTTSSGASYESSVNVNLSNMTLKAGAVGLKSTSVNDVRFSFSASAKANIVTKNNGEESTSDSDASFSIYIDKDGLYLDASGCSSVISALGSSTTTATPMKYHNPDIKIAAEKLPAISDDFSLSNPDFAQFLGSLSGEYKDHGNNVYSYSDSLDSDELNKMVQSVINYDGAKGMIADAKVTGDSHLGYALIFSDKGLTSLGVDANVNFSLGASESALGSAGMEFSLTFAAKAEFKSGSNFSIAELTNKASYTTVSK